MRGLVILMVILVLSACSTTKYVDRPIPVETVRTEYVNKLYKDSIFVHDSIDRYIRGDTVYQYKYKYIYKYLNRTDTIVKTDSIQIPVEIKTIEAVEVNHIEWYQKMFIWLGIVSLAYLIFKYRNIWKMK